jgi:hypothetical protein
MPKSPTLDTLLGLGCKGDRAAADLAARMFDFQLGFDPLSNHDPSLLAWLERRNRRSRRQGGLPAKVLRATGVIARERTDSATSPFYPAGRAVPPG